MIMNNNNLGVRPMQKISTHIFLAIFTGGIGNVVYGVSVYRKQKQWDRTVRSMNTNVNINK